MHRLGWWSVGLSSSAVLLAVSALHGVDAGLSSAGLLLEVGGLGFAASELQGRASKHGKLTVLVRAYRWVRRRLGIPVQVSALAGTATFTAEASLSASARISPAEVTGTLDERVVALEGQVRNLYENLGHVSAALGEVKNEHRESERRLSKAIETVGQDVALKLAEVETEGLDQAWAGLVATLAGVVLTAAAQLV